MPARQRLTTTSRLRPGSAQRTEYSVGTLATVLTVGVVVLLFASTFLAEWLRTPDFTLSTVNDLLSPNNDRDHDTVTINYTLDSDASVTAGVYNLNGGLVRVLLDEESLPSGTHNLLWDGRSQAGAVVQDGQYRLEIEAAGILRGTTRNVLLVVDTLPPALQLVNLNDKARVGTEAIIIQGVTDPNAMVWQSGEAQLVAVDASGRFAFQRRLAEGSNLIELRAMDQAGNTSVVSREITLVTEPPDITLLSPQEGGWTNGALVTVEGQASPGVTIKINDQLATVDDTGRFTHQVALNEGENRLQVQAIDDVGNISAVERVVYLKTTPPQVSLNVNEGDQVSDSLLLLSGRTEPGATVTINGRVISVGALGDFQTSLFLVEGDNLIQLTALDKAGNITQITRRVAMAPPGAGAGLARLWRNLASLPGLVAPVLAAGGLLLAFFFLRQNQVSLYLSVDQTAFTPGLPGEDRMLELALDLNKPAKITLEVLDEDGNLMATLLRSRRRSARIHLFRWDGYDDFGQPLPPGEYTIQATAGSPPLKVISAVQVILRADELVHRDLGRERITHRRREP